MTPENYEQPVPPPGIWPPPPTGQPGAWTTAPDTNTLTMPFKSVAQRAADKAVKAKYSDFREGSLQMSAAGLVISGKAILRAEIRLPIFIIALIFTRFIGIIVYLVTEYAFRRDSIAQVPWEAVRLVQLAPQKQQACVIYDAPNYKGIVKTFSLAFTLDPGSFAAFSQQVPQFVPGRMAEGALRNVMTARVWLRLIVLLGIVALATIAVMSQHH